MNIEVSIVPNTGAQSEVLATVAATSVQSSVLYTNKAGYVNVYSELDCFMRMGENPTTVNTGVDQFIPAGNLLRVGPIPPNFKLAFIAAAVGNVYITKESS